MHVRGVISAITKPLNHEGTHRFERASHTVVIPSKLLQFEVSRSHAMIALKPALEWWLRRRGCALGLVARERLVSLLLRAATFSTASVPRVHKEDILGRSYYSKGSTIICRQLSSATKKTSMRVTR